MKAEIAESAKLGVVWLRHQDNAFESCACFDQGCFCTRAFPLNLCSLVGDAACKLFGKVSMAVTVAFLSADHNCFYDSPVFSRTRLVCNGSNMHHSWMSANPPPPSPKHIPLVKYLFAILSFSHFRFFLTQLSLIFVFDIMSKNGWACQTINQTTRLATRGFCLVHVSLRKVRFPADGSYQQSFALIHSKTYGHVQKLGVANLNKGCIVDFFYQQACRCTPGAYLESVCFSYAFPEGAHPGTYPKSPKSLKAIRLSKEPRRTY